MRKTNKTTVPGGSERRRSVRKAVLETFHVFLVIPKRGVRKIYLKDVSAGGIGFYAEEDDRFEDGEVLECHFYINPSLRLPMTLRVAHVFNDGKSGDERQRKVGCEFLETGSHPHKAYVSFLALLDQLAAFILPG